MDDGKYLKGRFDQATGNFALVVGRFNHHIVDTLVQGALDILIRHGISTQHITVAYTPGAWEIPLGVQQILKKGQWQAVIALGAIIRGDTPHFEQIANQCNAALARLQLEYEIPITNGVLTVNSIEQAIERSGTKAGNKGAEAALAAVEMASLIKTISQEKLL